MRTRKPRRAGQAGFTMVEVMVAVLLTAIAVIGIIALYITETRASSYSRHATEASVLAADKLETLRTETLADGSYSDPSPLTPQGDDPNAPVGAFTRSWDITNVANAAP